MKLVIAVLLLSLSAFAQTAKVIQLAPEDAAKAKRLSQAVKDAQAEMDAFTEHVRISYLAAKRAQDSDCSSSVFFLNAPLPIRYIRGWSCGSFEYSDDYKFIVPKSESIPSQQNGRWAGPASGLTVAR